MIVDTSAVVAIFFQEKGFDGLLEKLVLASAAGIGAPTLAETAIVLSSRFDFDARPLLSRFLQESDLQVVAFGDAHWRESSEAYLRFGKGRHRARLNFGDCLSYATAKLAAQPLLCVGDDFRQTDLDIV